MFHADMTFAIALIALVSGALLVLSAKAHPDIPTLPCKIIGYTVVVLAIIVLLFSGCLVVKKSIVGRQMRTMHMAPYQMRQQRMMQPGMGPKDMQRGMMQPGMGPKDMQRGMMQPGMGPKDMQKKMMPSAQPMPLKKPTPPHPKPNDR